VVSEIGVNMDVFPTAKHLAPGQDLPLQMMKVPQEKVSKDFESRLLHQASFGTVCNRCRQKRETSRNPKPLLATEKA
jgi:hypothetical protein